MVAVMMLNVGCSDESASPTPKPAESRAPGATATASEATPPTAEVADSRSPAELIDAGRRTYNANCIACHAMDPTKDGALGPAIAGASPELIEARVIRGEYPEGYKPKRETKVMIALPHLKDKLPELAAYLDSLE
jgi:mono/diheme cytochrome c family protein